MKTLLVISLKNIKYIKKYLIVLLSIFMLFFFFIFLENYYNYKFNKEIINNINNRYIKINVSNIKDKNNFINNLNNNKNISLLYYEYPLIKFNKYNLSLRKYDSAVKLTNIQHAYSGYIKFIDEKGESTIKNDYITFNKMSDSR